MGEKREKKSKILKTNFAARIRDVSWLYGSRRKEELDTELYLALDVSPGLRIESSSPAISAIKVKLFSVPYQIIILAL